MSLLLEALQRAARSREDGAEPAPESSDSTELSLEPVVPPQTPERTASVSAPRPDQAATVMRASETPRYTAIDWMREHYMLTFVGAAILFAIGYGSYVYVQISNPAWLRPSGPMPTSPLQAAAAPAPAATSAPAKISGMPEEISAAGEAAPTKDAAAATGKSTGAVSGAAAPMQTAADSAVDGPVITGTAKRPATRRRARSAKATAEAAAPAQPGRAIEDGIEVVEIPASDSADKSTRPPVARDTISIREQPTSVAPVNPALLSAYQALQQGDNGKARQLYLQVLDTDSRNIDALLGMAAIAWKQGRQEEAGSYYKRVLDIDPRNAHAQAGLIAMLGSADPVAAESHLKQLIGREPSGFLYFTLGNLYAEQGLWPAAQQAYFQAFQFRPENPDYAFNLAVGLEHLGQEKVALEYYRKALELSFAKGRANFDQSLAIQRVGQLSARVE